MRLTVSKESVGGHRVGQRYEVRWALSSTFHRARQPIHGGATVKLAEERIGRRRSYSRERRFKDSDFCAFVPCVVSHKRLLALQSCQLLHSSELN
jgi:hypothetical protein